MTIQRMEHVGIVVDDLAAATAFFVELGFRPQGQGQVEGDWVDRIVGLEGVRTAARANPPWRRDTLIVVRLRRRSLSWVRQLNSSAARARAA